MKKMMILVAGLLASAGMIFMAPTLVVAGDNCTETALWGEVCEGDTENGIYKVLDDVLNVLTAGVGAAAVIGVVIAGIQYMTAGGNEVKMVKAKNRIIQVVIGLLVWALMWAALQWLIPGGLF